VALVVLAESDIGPDLGAAAGAGFHAMRHLGPAASFAGLYLEESGVPVPVSGDVLVIYLGHQFSHWPPGLVLIWLGLVATVVAGSTNLYLVSRRWGRRLAEGKLGLLLHLTPSRLAAAERWFGRWGVPAIVFGRHILGFRVPITVAAGICRVPYPTFAISVAISTAIWAAAWLWLGATFGGRLAVFLGRHHWAYAFLLLGLVLVAGGAVIAHHRERRRAPTPLEGR
jgi:membrane protein DedA with SNARE-associated domain